MDQTGSLPSSMSSAVRLTRFASKSLQKGAIEGQKPVDEVDGGNFTVPPHIKRFDECHAANHALIAVLET